MYDAREGRGLPWQCEEWKEQLALLLAGVLPSTDRKALDEHTQSCSACSAVLAEYYVIDEYLRRSFAVEPLPDLPPQLVEIWRTEEEKWRAVAKEHRLLPHSLSHAFAYMRSWRVITGKHRIMSLGLALAVTLGILTPLIPVLQRSWHLKNQARRQDRSTLPPGPLVERK